MASPSPLVLSDMVDQLRKMLYLSSKAKVLMELAYGGAIVVGHGSVCHAKNITLFRT
ncbi:hypothetical protein Hanom_Chr07g00622081 [Helianthus anomalus]